MAEAAGRRRQLIVCPEMAVSGYVWADDDAVRPFAEVADGPTARALQRAVAGTDAWVVAGIAERDGDALYNSAIVVNRDGLQSVYRKILLYEVDMTWAAPGVQRVVVQTPFGRLAPAICMDINDPRFSRWIGVARPDVIAFCTNWIDEGHDPLGYWRMRLGGWDGVFVAANAWGVDGGVPFCGRSAIVDRGGRLVARGARTGNAVVDGEVGGPFRGQGAEQS